MTNIENNNGINITGLLIGVSFSAVITSILLWLVGIFGLDLVVKSLGAAIMAGTAIAVPGGVITWLLSILPKKINQAVAAEEMKEPLP